MASAIYGHQLGPKIMAAMIRFIRDHEFKDKKVLFRHTYNTRDLSPLLSSQPDPSGLPQASRHYFK